MLLSVEGDNEPECHRRYSRIVLAGDMHADDNRKMIGKLHGRG